MDQGKGIYHGKAITTRPEGENSEGYVGGEKHREQKTKNFLLLLK